ncbi:hypothetical protein C1645_871287 [Glomus cerebriforme]|uniref:Uncharacterized protein n=1 Tax=Glomus cerebriforme TaxID=658196 RepID=A0A397S882_9GLOM|nr:hypothetical protein C1645_841991 [Glomus cerebriforme]RIA97533.1 hypothetical protein C1645_871287 [Glomus cerebriforme]
MTEISSTSQKPQLKTSFSFLSSNNIFPESSNHQQIYQSPSSYSPKENNDPSFINNSKKSKSNTFSSILSNSRSSSFFKRRRSETYQENDEFTSGCFGSLSTLGSKLSYKINNNWKRIKRRLHKKKKPVQNEWKSKAKTLNQL